jgi:hypothetical protein
MQPAMVRALLPGGYGPARAALDEAGVYRRLKRRLGAADAVAVFDLARTVRDRRGVSWDTAIDIAERKLEQDGLLGEGQG